MLPDHFNFKLQTMVQWYHANMSESPYFQYSDSDDTIIHTNIKLNDIQKYEKGQNKSGVKCKLYLYF
jgi:hypothetical protein